MNVPFNLSPIFEWNYYCKKPIVVNQGGTSSGKTYSILQMLYCKAAEKTRRITVLGQDMPNLKVGAIRDWETILNSCDFFRMFIAKVNISEKVWTFTNGSILEFKSYENSQDAKSGKRDILFVNEANGVSYPIFEEQQVRTTEQVFIDYNPTAPFWAHTKLIGQEGVQLFISNYTHNPFLDERIKQKIENYKLTDLERWRVYGLGLTGKTEGVIFKKVNWISEFPKHIRRISYGLDFGFNDPTVLVKCGTSDGELYLQRMLYESEMLNPDINKAFIELGIKKSDYIFADSADPKTITDLRKSGWAIFKAKKGPDSIIFGIKEILKYHKLNIVHCEHWKEEQSKYVWTKDKSTDDLKDKPIEKFDHLWDASRYGIQGLDRKSDISYS